VLSRQVLCQLEPYLISFCFSLINQIASHDFAGTSFGL
jgi:hypothetical protein